MNDVQPRMTPATPRMLERLRAVKGFVFDMDGTLILGDKRNDAMRALPGARELIELLISQGVPYVVLTNGTVRSPRDYIEVLSAAGIPMREGSMMTPSSV